MHPKGEIVNFPCHHFSLNVDEWKVYINCAKMFTGRIIVEFFSKFKWLKSVIPVHILHICSKEMAQKSTIVSLPHLNKNWFMLSMRTVYIELWMHTGSLESTKEV